VKVSTAADAAVVSRLAPVNLPTSTQRPADAYRQTKIDRLARSVADDVCAIVKRIESTATLLILDLGLDTSTSDGRFMLNVFGSVAQFEREVILKRQGEEIAKAKGKGKYKGRKPTARAKAKEIHRLAADGVTREAIAGQLKIGVASVYCALRQAA
jgi:DNA invertase Pin-like site-specific DNA recombinase